MKRQLRKGSDRLARQRALLVALSDDLAFPLLHVKSSVELIAADNFGLEPTEGKLIAATRTRYTLRRSDERAGTVHVHFPRVGFTLKKAAA